MKRIVKFSVNGLTQTHNAAPFVSRSFDARPPSTCNVSALPRSTRDKFRYFARPRIVTDRSESRPVGKGPNNGGKSHCSLETRVSLRSTGWNQTYSRERERDIDLAFILAPSFMYKRRSWYRNIVINGHLRIDRGIMIVLERERRRGREKFLASLVSALNFVPFCFSRFNELVGNFRGGKVSCRRNKYGAVGWLNLWM